MDEAKIKKELAAAIPFVDEYPIRWINRQELSGERQLLDVEEYGITSTCQIRERLFVMEPNGPCREITISPRKVRKKHYGEEVPVDTPGDMLSQVLTGNEETILIVHSSILTQPKGPHQFKKIIEAYH